MPDRLPFLLRLLAAAVADAIDALTTLVRPAPKPKPTLSSYDPHTQEDA